LSDAKKATVKALLEKRASPAARFVPGEVIVKLKENTPVQPVEDTARRLGLQMARSQTSKGGEFVYRLPPATIGALSESNQTERTLAAVKEFQSRPDVEYAQPNFRVQISRTPNDSSYGAQWHYFSRGSGAGQAPGGIGLPQEWDVTVGPQDKTKQIVVAVIDTGILPDHEDIAGSEHFVGGFDMVSDRAMANDGDGRDNNPTDPGDAVAANECGAGSRAFPSSWHGTHVAGIIGVGKTDNNLGIAGVNWNVKVVAVRVLGKCGGTIADINDGIRWAAGLQVPGAAINVNPAKVINMSLGGEGACSQSPATQSAINDAVQAGAVVVVAAGNEGQDAAGFFPASCSNVITVAASDRRGRLVERYSNFGSRIDIVAPGGDVDRDDDGDQAPDGILSMVKGGYELYNGTSMAAPHVAGVAALLLAEDTNRTPSQILNILKSRAAPMQCTPAHPCGTAGLLSAVSRDNTPQPPQPPQQPQPALTIDAKLSAGEVKVGGTVNFTATVLRNGAAAADVPVAFSSNDESIATIAPSSAQTDATGRATAIVTKKAAGPAQVNAKAGDSLASAVIHDKKKKWPALPPSFSAVLLALLGLLAIRAMTRKRTT
jgi:serine protease